MKILVLTKMKISQSAIDSIQPVVPDAEIYQATHEREVWDLLPEIDILVTRSMDISREGIARAAKVKWIHSLAVGVDQFFYPEFLTRKIVLTNNKGGGDISCTEHAFAFMLAWARGIDRAVKNQLKGQWTFLPTTHLEGKTIGIIGLGGIGRAIAKKAKLGFDMRVIATKKAFAEADNVDLLLPPERLGELLAESDYVVMAAAATPETVGMLGEEEFRRMKPTAFFVNIARGELVNEAALTRALKEKWIAGAGLDVFTKEPLPEDSELWQLSNVIISPHAAGFSSQDLLDLRIKTFTDDLQRYLKGERLHCLVDPARGY